MWGNIVKDSFYLVYVGGYSGDYINSLPPFERDYIFELLINTKKRENEPYEK